MAHPKADIALPSLSIARFGLELMVPSVARRVIIYEARWLRSPRIANDYCRYWLRTPGAQPRNYSTWLADSVWATHLVHPNQKQVVDLLPRPYQEL